MPAIVKVKRLAAESVVQKGGYTWAGQIFGGNFESDGRPMSEEVIKTVVCDTGVQTCTITVKEPGMALLFLMDNTVREPRAGTHEHLHGDGHPFEQIPAWEMCAFTRDGCS
ncbi:hypothetical protein C8R43DRAFT_132801 [Mycena crocata]|nr:hypothetical protein C8R43DRAFT_132801 [Mycena crocata]